MSASRSKLRAPTLSARLASRHYENFPPLVSCPRDKRDALAAVYAFARYADDVADEPGSRTVWKSCRLARPARGLLRGKIDHPVFLALRDSAERFASRARTLKTCCARLSRMWW